MKKIKEVSGLEFRTKIWKQVCVWIQLHDLTALEIKEYCRGKIAHYTIPAK
jgi:fatty-acyl-CoA synthase